MRHGTGHVFCLELLRFVEVQPLPGEALRLRSGWDYGMIVMLRANVDLIWLWVRG